MQLSKYLKHLEPKKIYQKSKPPKPKQRDDEISEVDKNRLIEMAWQDRMPFDIIFSQYGLTENQLKNKMRTLISKKAYDRWRKRVQGRTTKHIKKCDHKPVRFQGPW